VIDRDRKRETDRHKKIYDVGERGEGDVEGGGVRVRRTRDE